MAAIQGVPVTGAVVPKDSQDTYRCSTIAEAVL